MSEISELMLKERIRFQEAKRRVEANAKSELAPARGSEVWMMFRSGDVVEYNGTAWLVWEESEQKHVLCYNLFGAVTVIPRAMLKKVEPNSGLNPQNTQAERP